VTTAPRTPRRDGLRPAEVHIAPRRLARLGDLLDPEGFALSCERLRSAADLVRGRVVWHVNSTARGGGVAEMMGSLIGYSRDAGADARWLVIAGTPDFFAVTKRLHNMLHGDPGDAGGLGAAERRVYEGVLRENAVELAAVVRPGDVVVLHDPQTAGLIPAMRRRGAIVVWRCHIGSERLDDPRVSEAWAFLERYLPGAHAAVFTREAYVPACCRAGRVAVIQPSIDPFSPKNQDLAPAVVRAILVDTGLVEGPDGESPVFVRDDGAPGRVDRGADILRVGRAPGWETPLVVQVSRWDRLKDPAGVMAGFARLDAADAAGAHLVLAGPAVTAVADDPEAPEVLGEVTRAWRALPHDTRRRVQLVALPMADPGENAAIVNALQRHATVVVQKSIEEGFGLTVTEAMWKGRPVVASAVGGITEQIRDNRDGLLVPDPRDLDGFAGVLRGLLADPARQHRLGVAARERVLSRFLPIRHLTDYAQLVGDLITDHGSAHRPDRPARAPRAAVRPG
jgi:trehalose synthase